MIRAIVRDGVIHPLDQPPAEWEGREVRIEAVDTNAEACDDNWAKDVEAIVSTLTDPEEWQRFKAALAEAREEDKASVRREMGLP
jgi:hypothetical protein